ncbi:hypothetical protein E2C06_20150 [Dankookia rubra]|uniref:STAS/SEC14 domain-containing protein n=1 Tax=Dankookia rubra TaxID=1442381 RepID=A0A4R5QE95_9PROT|nr:hypothetical protein [Dankookia rubra]TDH60811.1 hypothetical protein E2C06_20150 [Dankookia rubra]
MVHLEAEPAGILTLRFGPPYAEDDEPAYLAALKAIGVREQPFVLLAIFGGRGRLSPAGERAQALWFKATRRQLEQRCRALAIVRPGDPGGSAAVFSRLWAFPVAVQETEADGRSFLAGHLPVRP